MSRLSRAGRRPRPGVLALKPNSQLIHELAQCRWSLAQSYSRWGDDESASSMVLANFRMLDEVPKRTTVRRSSLSGVELARLDLHQFQAGLSSPQAQLPRPGRSRLSVKAHLRRKPIGWMQQAGPNWWPGV